MSTKIDFSPIESDVLGLKTGRCNSDFFDETMLYKQIVEGSYDICRLKVSAEDEMAAYRLNNTGMPAFFSGSIRRYKTRISENPPGNYNYTDLVFEIYDGTQDNLLKDMLIGTWGTYPIGYYRTPYLQHLVNKKAEIECVFQYYKKFNLNQKYPANSIVFIKHGDNYVGFFALNIVDNNLESHIGGILEPYRKSGYFLDKLRYIKEFCIKNQLGYFIFGARNENAEVQKIFQFVGFQSRGSENVFHIPALLTVSQLEPIVKEVKFQLKDRQAVYSELLKNALSLITSDVARLNGYSFHLNEPVDFTWERSTALRFSFPVVTDNEMMITIRSLESNSMPVTGYLRLFKK